MVLGLRADGTMAHVRDVAPGLDCRCVCPACGTALVARKGRDNAHHFGHLGSRDEAPCRVGPETALHLFAKEILAERLEMRLPERVLVVDDDRELICNGGTYRFDAATLEKHLGDMVPDVVVRRGDRELLVEFKVTHPCGEDKLTKIRERDLAVVEIDLSGLPRNFDKDGIARSILWDAPRAWLHNPLDAAAKEKLATRRRIREEVRTADIRRRADAYRHHTTVRAESPEASQLAKRLRADGWTNALGIAVGGSECFIVPCEEWQAVSLDMLIRDAFGGKFQGISIVKIRDELKIRKLIRREYLFVAKIDAEALKRECPDFAPPYEAIALWLRVLSERKLIAMVGASTARLSLTEIERLVGLRERRARPRKRRSELSAAVERALDGLPSGEVEGFELGQWLGTRLPGRAFSPLEAILEDGNPFASLASDIRMLRHYLEHSPARVTELFGLPLEAERDRRLLLIQQRKEREEQKRRAVLEQAAAQREAAIRRFAGETLESDADAWLSIEHPDLGVDPVTASRSGEVVLGKAMELVRTAGRVREAAHRAELAAEAARLELRRTVAKVLRDPRHVDLYLECRHPALSGVSPLDFCTNHVRLAQCISKTLPKKPRRGI